MHYSECEDMLQLSLLYVHVPRYICLTVFFIISAYSTKVSKFPQKAKPDEDLGFGIKYTFVEDGHKFETEGATLR